MIPPTLEELAQGHATDKNSNHHNYTPLYEHHLAPLRYKKIRLLELGLLHGASARMWHDYFPRGTFWFVDISDSPVPPRSTLYVGDQADPEGYRQAIKDGLFDVIIDDASHEDDKTIASFKLYWEALKPGGLYAIEDLQISYTGPPHPGTPMEFLKKLTDEVNRKYAERGLMGYDIEWIHFHCNIAFIRKTL